MGVCTIRVPSALKLTEEPNLAELPVRPVNVVAAPPRAHFFDLVLVAGDDHDHAAPFVPQEGHKLVDGLLPVQVVVAVSAGAIGRGLGVADLRLYVSRERVSLVEKDRARRTASMCWRGGVRGGCGGMEYGGAQGGADLVDRELISETELFEVHLEVTLLQDSRHLALENVVMKHCFDPGDLPDVVSFASIKDAAHLVVHLVPALLLYLNVAAAAAAVAHAQLLHPRHLNFLPGIGYSLGVAPLGEGERAGEHCCAACAQHAEARVPRARARSEVAMPQ